jgi:hypothetical protein
MAITCSHCLNQVREWREGIMTVQVAHHYLNNAGLCPGSGERRSLAR